MKNFTQPNNYDKFILAVSENANKNHWKVRKLVKEVNEHISGLRLTAWKMKRTVVSKWCHSEANRLEKNLNKALVTFA